MTDIFAVSSLTLSPSSVDLYGICSINYQTWHETDFAEKTTFFLLHISNLAVWSNQKSQKSFNYRTREFPWREKYSVCGLTLWNGIWLWIRREKYFIPRLVQVFTKCLWTSIICTLESKPWSHHAKVDLSECWQTDDDRDSEATVFNTKNFWVKIQEFFDKTSWWKNFEKLFRDFRISTNVNKI